MRPFLFVLLLALTFQAWVWVAFGTAAMLFFLSFLLVPAVMIGGVSLVSMATR